MTSIAIVMDPIESINYKKDSSLAMLWAAQDRDCELYYITKDQLYSIKGEARANCCSLKVFRDANKWFEKGEYKDRALSDFDVILMRLDPPYDMEYIYITHLLELAQQHGTLIANNAQSLRLCSEKLSTGLFPDLCPESLVTNSQERLREFVNKHKDIIVKPLDGMGGTGIFRVQENDKNTGVILETITQLNQRTVMAQKYIPEIKDGDKRILMINGEPVPYALARIPGAGENRGNLAAGGTGQGLALSEHDKHICSIVGPWLRENKVGFAGLDVIGEYLTEINVTSPTCIRELNEQFNLDIAGDYIDYLLETLA